MPYMYLLIWSGGYDSPQMEMFSTSNAAVKQGQKWAEDVVDDAAERINVVRIDMATQELTPYKLIN